MRSGPPQSLKLKIIMTNGICIHDLNPRNNVPFVSFTQNIAPPPLPRLPFETSHQTPTIETPSNKSKHPLLPIIVGTNKHENGLLLVLVRTICSPFLEVRIVGALAIATPLAREMPTVSALDLPNIPLTHLQNKTKPMSAEPVPSVALER